MNSVLNEQLDQLLFQEEELQRKSSLLLALKAELQEKSNKTREQQPPQHQHSTTPTPIHESDLQDEIKPADLVDEEPEAAQLTQVSASLLDYVHTELAARCTQHDQQQITGATTASKSRRKRSSISSVQVRAVRTCTFALPPGHTFNQLLSDVAAYWNIPKDVLRDMSFSDARGALFDSHERVQDMLVMYTPPQRMLHLRIRMDKTNADEIRKFNPLELRQQLYDVSLITSTSNKNSLETAASRASVLGGEEKKLSATSVPIHTDQTTSNEDVGQSETANAGEVVKGAKVSAARVAADHSEYRHLLRLKKWKIKYQKLNLILADHDMDSTNNVFTTDDANTAAKAHHVNHIRKAIRASLLLELIAWLPFLVLFTLAVLQRFGVSHGVAQSMALRQRLTGRNSSWRKDVPASRFHDIASTADFWKWARGPLVATFANESTCYDSISSSDVSVSDHCCFSQSNIVIGSIRLRQQRVEKRRCALESEFVPSWCYPAYETKVRDETDLMACTNDNAATPIVDHNFCTFADYTMVTKERNENKAPVPKWKDAAELTWYDHGTLVSTYDSSGYFAQALPGSKFSNLVEELFNASWVDEGTRVVMVEFNTVNPHTRRVGIIKIVIQFTVSGELRPSVLVLVTEPFASSMHPWSKYRSFVMLLAVAYLLGMLVASTAVRKVRKYCQDVHVYDLSDESNSKVSDAATVWNDDCAGNTGRQGGCGDVDTTRRQKKKKKQGRKMTTKLKKAIKLKADIWIWIDIFIIIIGFVISILEFKLMALGGSIEADEDGNYQELYTSIGRPDRYVRSMVAALCGLVAFRMVKFFKLVREGQDLLSAARYSTQPLIVLGLLISFPILLGLALLTWLVFGPTSADFASLGDALVSVEQLGRGANNIGLRLPALLFPFTSVFVLVCTLAGLVLFTGPLFVVALIESFDAVVEANL